MRALAAISALRVVAAALTVTCPHAPRFAPRSATTHIAMTSEKNFVQRTFGGFGAALMGTKPQTAVGLPDIWSGARADKDEIDEILSVATSSTISKPIISQYFPGRRWLWRQWSGTIVRRVLPRDVLINIAFAMTVGWIFRSTAHTPFRSTVLHDLASVQKVWTLAATMVSFTLSFFLSQAYSMWRSVYSLSRRVQGRLNDLGLLCATYACLLYTSPSPRDS